MARIAKQDVHAALNRAASNIVDASRGDGVVSRKDIGAKLEELKGTERRLTDVFFRFIDHRDAAPSARVTKADVDRAVAYASDKLIDAYDLNNNGLSKDEIAAMSLTGKLAVELARELKGAAAAERPTDVARRVLAEYGVEGMKISVDDGEVERQLATHDSAIGFEAALRQALDSYITDASEYESPLFLCTEDIDIEPGMPSDPQELVRWFMNKPTAELKIMGGDSRGPENGEQVADNWIFELELDSLSDHFFWAVVPRDGESRVYNYGFN